MHITIFAINNAKVRFFIRVANCLKNEHDITFLTTSFSSYLILKKNNYRVHMLQSFIRRQIDNEEFSKYEEDAILLDVKALFLKKSNARIQFDLLTKGFKNYFVNNRTNILFLWNASRLQGYTASIVADNLDIKKLYFETGNFPNKLFIDRQGVNAKSSLTYRDISKCKHYNEDKILNFLKEHKAKKEKLHTVPQATNKKINYFISLDLIYNLFSKYNLTEDDTNILKKVKNKIFLQNILFEYDNISLEKISYFFFPLQVSTDSQIIRNSNVNLKDAIDIALADAQKSDCTLLIKPHPAEKNSEIVKHIISLKKKNKNIYFVNNNTYRLIKYSKKVITINSTVGIESLMYYKPTFVLGEAFYKKYCASNTVASKEKEKIKHFLYCYLFEILNEGNFFGRANISLNKGLLNKCQ